MSKATRTQSPAAGRGMDGLTRALASYSSGLRFEDIPAQVRSAAARHPTLTIRIADPLGPHEKLVDVLLERAERALGS